MKVSLISLTQPILLLLLCWAPNFSFASSDPLVKWLNPMVDWLRSKPNGFFSDKISWQRYDPNHPESGYAMYAAEDIPKDETIMVIPQSAIIQSETKGSCETVKKLLEEHAKGEDSEFFLYLDYIFGDKSKRGIIPSSWSDAGKKLMKLVVGNSLFPAMFSFQKIQYFCPNISKNPTELEEFAYEAMITRSWGHIMMPVFDMINHRNGKWRNVESTSAHVGEDVRVFAYRDIAAGEQLYLSYNECNDETCTANDEKYKYSANHMLVDYGFVEQYPTRIFVDSTRTLLAEVDIDETTGQAFLTWPKGNLPNLDQVNYMVAQIKRLYEIEDDVTNGLAELESDHERYVVREWYRAMKEVLELAVAYRDGEKKSVGGTATQQYDTLTEGKGLGVHGTNVEVCWENPSDQHYDLFDQSKSQYQEIEFTYNRDQDNTCLRLSGWLQTCTNFRPHYHEAFVHVPAQYVDDVKRVAFLGGGDNMILHEILKYPNLELVVGMELDQQVIRSAYKNLGTLPYFDDHRVHWWFGDATKSLLALPESYFGSFDLVLVDLQTFVADALKVTDKLTIMETAILLMKQDGGVIAKNEDFSVRTNVGFAKYTVDLEYHDLPQICQQSITMGSNSIDFVTAETKAHDIEVLAIDLPDAEDADPFHAWYSYRQTIHDTCAATYDENENSTKSDQVGILVIVEAENLTLSLESTTEAKKMISDCIKGLGLTEVAISADSDDSNLVFVLNEGYVTARVFAEQNYIAFDVLLWNSLDLIDTLNEELVKAVGGNVKESTTSFRFVSGGMSGMYSSEKDVLTEVASKTDALLCQDVDSSVALTSADNSFDSVMSSIFADFVTTLVPRHAGDVSSVVGILCGDVTSVCSSLETAKKLDTLPLEVVPIHSCGSFETMDLCEKEVREKFAGITKQHKKLDALVMDATLPFPMGQIIESIFSDPITHSEIMERRHILFTPIVEEEAWRSVLIDRFRTDIVLFDGAFRADLQFFKMDSGKKDSYLKWSLFSAYDDDFFNHLSSTLSVIKEGTGLEPEVKEIANGIVNYVADFHPSKIFTDSDYDKTRSLKQWNSQTPMGHQTIFHMSLQPPKMRLADEERVLAEHEPGPWGAVYGGATVLKFLGNEKYTVLYDGEILPETISRDQIRKFSDVDRDSLKNFEVGDLIFYEVEEELYENGVISGVAEDGTYSIYMLNPSGEKVYGVEKDELLSQFETADFYQKIPDLSAPKLIDAFEKAITTKVLDSKKALAVNSFPIGKGIVVTAFWKEGHAIMKWDGMRRVDINFFTYEENPKLRFVFQDAFCDEIDHMNKVSRDEHPRGYGSVVNFSSEIAKPPHWVEEPDYDDDDDYDDDYDGDVEEED